MITATAQAGPQLQLFDRVGTSTARSEFEALALPQARNLYAAAVRLTRNPAEAEDLVQDAMVRAWRFWDSFKQGTNIKAWLHTILRNTFINDYHRKGRERDLSKAVSADVYSVGPSIAVGNTTAPPAADEAVEATETQARVAEALATLPPDYRAAVTMADLEGLSYKDIAEAMDCPIGTVMSRIYRGRKILYKLLHDHARDLGMVDGDGPAERPSTRGVR